MRSREHSATLVFSLAAFLFALLAGVFIPLTGGGARPAALNWTPPPTAIATATAGRSAPTSVPTATSVPTITLSPTQRVTKAATKPPTGTSPAVTFAQRGPVKGDSHRHACPAGSSAHRTGATQPAHRPGNRPTAYWRRPRAATSSPSWVARKMAVWVQLCCVADSRAWAAAEFAGAASGHRDVIRSCVSFVSQRHHLAAAGQLPTKLRLGRSGRPSALTEETMSHRIAPHSIPRAFVGISVSGHRAGLGLSGARGRGPGSANPPGRGRQSHGNR